MEQLRLLGAAVAEMNESVTITDADLSFPGPRILFVNPAFTRLTGYTAADVVGKSPRILQGPRTDRVEIARLRRELNASLHFHGRTYNYRKDGQEFLMDWKISPVRDSAGNVTNFIGVQHDASEEADARAEQASLERMELLGRTAAGIAHDLNNVMTAMLSLADEVAFEVPAARSLQEIAQDLTDATDYATALTRQLMALSRRQEPKRENIQLGSLLRHIQGLLRRLIRRDVELSLILPEPDCCVHAVSGQMEQIIINLVVNASDAVRHHGHVRVSVDRIFIAEGDENAGATVPGEYALLRVEDDGVGMDEHTKSCLFTPFFTTKPEGKGTGIGLASVHANVRGMNGMVRVISEPDQGSEFLVYIPLVVTETVRAAVAGRTDW